MKIVKTTDTSLKVIPRSYPDTVDLSIRNERTNITTEETNITVTSDGGYLDIPLTSDVVSGVKCIAANNEYLSSPIGQYFPNSMNDMDVEIDFENFENVGFPLEGNMLQQGEFFANGFYVGIDGSTITVGSLFNQVSYDTGLSQPISGNIKLIGNGVSIDVLWDGVVVANLVTPQPSSEVNGYPLYFNSSSALSVDNNITYNYIKINDHEWTSTNWTAPTTTNSEGVVTTLNSDVSTSAMIQSTNTPIYTFTENNNYDFEVSSEGERIYKGKIFCTDQTDYSINNGRYTERVVTRNYITR